MRISSEKLDTFLTTLHQYTCPLCGHDKWNADNMVFYLGEFFLDSVRIGTPQFPVLPITCVNCGNTLFINALVAGLIDATENKNLGQTERKDKSK